MATSVNHMVDHWQRECWQLAGGFACVNSEKKTKEASEKKHFYNQNMKSM